jgi:hypothetical protein
MAVMCPQCGSSEIDLKEVLEDERRRIRCESCGHEWLRGEARVVYKSTTSIDDLRLRFPSPDDVEASVAERAERLKREFLAANPSSTPQALDFRERYQRIFSRQGIEQAAPAELKYFANSNLAGNPGNMSVFNTAWNEMGEEEAARRVKGAVEYLLYGPEDSFLEDRLTNLIEGRHGLGMPGFREALLTKVLCMVEPTRFLPINKYTGQAGKKEIAKWAYDLNLPRPQSVSWTIGRLIIWSNDLLLELAGEGFQDTEHAASFLWWAKDEMRRRAGVEPSGTTDDDPDYVIYKDDDEGFRDWLRQHPSGFYMNAARTPSPDYLMLHRVGCMHVGDAESRDVGWTVDYIKICSPAKMELEAWARAVVGGEPTHCQTCAP